MKLFHVWLEGSFYDTVTDYLVYANSESQAREIVAEIFDNEYWKDMFLNPKYSSIEEIIKPYVPGIVLEFFTPG